MKRSAPFMGILGIAFCMILSLIITSVHAQMPPPPDMEMMEGPDEGPPPPEFGPPQAFEDDVEDLEAGPPMMAPEMSAAPMGPPPGSPMGQSASPEMDDDEVGPPPPGGAKAGDLPESEITITPEADKFAVMSEVIKGLHSAALEIEKKAQKDADEVDDIVKPLHEKHRNFDKTADMFHNEMGEKIGSYVGIVAELRTYAQGAVQGAGSTEPQADPLVQLKVKINNFEKELNKVRAAVEEVASFEARMLEQMRVADNRRADAASAAAEIGKMRRNIVQAKDEKKARSLFEKVISQWGGIKKTKEYIKERVDSFGTLISDAQKQMDDIRTQFDGLQTTAGGLKEEIEEIGQAEAAHARADEEKVARIIAKELDEKKSAASAEKIERAEKEKKKEIKGWKGQLQEIGMKFWVLVQKVAKKLLELAADGLDWLAEKIKVGTQAVKAQVKEKLVKPGEKILAPPAEPSLEELVGEAPAEMEIPPEGPPAGPPATIEGPPTPMEMPSAPPEGPPEPEFSLPEAPQAPPE